MKYLIALAAIGLAIYTGVQSYLIAQVGIVNQIPQLVGDGGGGMVVTALCALAGLLALFKTLPAAVLFVLSTLTAILVGLTYQDPTTLLWAVGPFVFAVAILFSRISKRRKIRQVKTSSH